MVFEEGCALSEAQQICLVARSLHVGRRSRGIKTPPLCTQGRLLIGAKASTDTQDASDCITWVLSTKSHAPTF